MHECSTRVPRSGMDDHPGWFVDDDQIFIFVENVESNCLRLERRLDELRRRYVESVAHLYGLTRSTRAIVDADAIGIDPPPRLRAGDSRDCSECAVESLTRFGLADGQVEDGHGPLLGDVAAGNSAVLEKSPLAALFVAVVESLHVTRRDVFPFQSDTIRVRGNETAHVDRVGEISEALFFDEPKVGRRSARPTFGSAKRSSSMNRR